VGGTLKFIGDNAIIRAMPQNARHSNEPTMFSPLLQVGNLIAKGICIKTNHENSIIAKSSPMSFTLKFMKIDIPDPTNAIPVKHAQNT